MKPVSQIIGVLRELALTFKNEVDGQKPSEKDNCDWWPSASSIEPSKGFPASKQIVVSKVE